MAFFPSSDNMESLISGALVKGEMHKPSMDGTIIFLNANPDIQYVLIKLKNMEEKLSCPEHKSAIRLVIWHSSLIPKETGWHYMQKIN